MKSIKTLLKAYGDFKILKYETQNEKYEGLIIETAGANTIRSRLGRSTPKKAGYFTAFWEKNFLNKNQPFQVEAGLKDLVIVVQEKNYEGVFIIPMEVAIKHQIITNGGKTGKMAMRFYPPWCQELNQTAEITQKWQLIYFKDYSEEKFNRTN